METRFYNINTQAFIEKIKGELIYLNIGSQYYFNKKAYRVKDQCFKTEDGVMLMFYMVDFI